MEKQHNRGQDGAGIVGVKLDVPPGKKFINRVRSNSNTPIKDCFVPIFDTLSKLHQNDEMKLFDTEWLKNNIDFASELLLGHLRYNTSGKSDISNVHPFIRNNNWKTRNLVLAGNFNMTNLDELFQKLIDIGQHPVETSDAITILEKIGSFLDEEVEKVYRKHKSKDVSKHDATQIIEENLDILDILKRSAKYWDGGYVIAGMLGHGDSFVMRDPKGIRPAYYYHDDEVIVVASERPAIQTAFNIPFDKVKELPEGNAIIIRKSGEFSVDEFIAPQVPEKCSFERIYFSRGTDLEIYKERRALGKHLVPEVLKSINYDFANTVFSYIPNTAIVAFLGMFDELRKYCNDVKRDMLLAAAGDLTTEKIDEILSLMPRIDQVAVKDTKLRTFISQGKQRDDLVAHVYDVTYGTIADDIDHLVVLDDSIVRGSTLKDSIIKMLSRLKPKKIIIASSAPQIRYPDCYGIDMTRMNEFIAFRATIQLLKDTKQTHIINDVYKNVRHKKTYLKSR